jgi:hypothetical protein
MAGIARAGIASTCDESFAQQLGIIGVLLLTSKGAAGVTGSGFIVLAPTLSSVGHIPVASIAMTRDCFEPGSALCGRGELAIASGDGFGQSFPYVLAEVIASSQTLTSRSSISVDGGVVPHHRSPTSAIEPAGQDLGARMRSG